MSSGDTSQFKPSNVPPAVPMNDGGAPLRPGMPYYSDETKKQLSLVGWQEGDPLPPNFGEALTELRNQAAAEKAKAYSELPEKMAGYVPPKQKIVDIETLPKEKQDELRRWLAGYRDDVAVLSAPAPPPPRPQPQPEPEPEPQPEAKPAAPSDVPTHCTRCMWPVGTPFNITVTDEDKNVFLISILNGKDFQKQYDLLGDTVRLRVRSLTITEVSMVNVQLGYMVRAGIISGNLEYLNYNMLYRTALGTVELKAGAHILYPGMTLEKFNETHQCTGENPTTLPEYLETFTNALRSEVVVQIVNRTYREFQRLIELLEEKTNSSDFWKGIVLQGS